MATVEGVIAEIKDMAAIIAKRPDNVGLMNGLVASVCGKIKTIKSFGTGQANQLYEAIEGIHFGKDQLTKTIDDRLGGGLTARGCTFTGYQQMRFMHNYMTQRDWHEIRAANGDAGTIAGVIVRRLSRLGVKNPSDDGCIKWAVAIVCHQISEATNAWPTYRSSYIMSNDVKTKFLTQRHAAFLPHLEQYPEFPRDLPQVTLFVL